jgi:hypothetical protein
MKNLMPRLGMQRRHKADKRFTHRVREAIFPYLLGPHPAHHQLEDKIRKSGASHTGDNPRQKAPMKGIEEIDRQQNDADARPMRERLEHAERFVNLAWPRLVHFAEKCGDCNV